MKDPNLIDVRKEVGAGKTRDGEWAYSFFVTPCGLEREVLLYEDELERMLQSIKDKK